MHVSLALRLSALTLSPTEQPTGPAAQSRIQTHVGRNPHPALPPLSAQPREAALAPAPATWVARQVSVLKTTVVVTSFALCISLIILGYLCIMGLVPLLAYKFERHRTFAARETSIVLKLILFQARSLQPTPYDDARTKYA